MDGEKQTKKIVVHHESQGGYILLQNSKSFAWYLEIFIISTVPLW